MISKIKNLIVDYRELFIALVIASVMLLPVAIYVGASRNGNNSSTENPHTGNKGQATDQSKEKAQTTKTDKATGSSSQNNGNRSSSSQSGGGTGHNNTYKAPTCTDKAIPYKTSILLGIHLGTGTTEVIKGSNGYTRTCTADSTGYTPSPTSVNPVNETIYVGTGGISATTPPRTTPPEPDQLDRIKSDCSQQLAVHKNQEAYNLCVATLARYFNIPL